MAVCAFKRQASFPGLKSEASGECLKCAFLVAASRGRLLRLGLCRSLWKKQAFVPVIYKLIKTFADEFM